MTARTINFHSIKTQKSHYVIAPNEIAEMISERNGKLYIGY